jgi:hypothetical protein
VHRRDFLKGATLATGPAACSDFLVRSVSGEDNSGQPQHASEARMGDMLYRTLGRTSERNSAIGLGGYHIGVQGDENDSIRIIRTAIDRGMTFMDNC